MWAHKGHKVETGPRQEGRTLGLLGERGFGPHPHHSTGTGSQEELRAQRRGPAGPGAQLCGLRWEWVAWQPQVSLSQPHRARPRRSEVENRHIKEVTDSFTLVQVVDVIVVSRGWRKAEEGGKHF